MFRYESVNSTRKFTIVAEIVSLLKKIYKRDAPFRAVFKVKTLAVLFSAYPREMKHIPRNLNLPPFWRCLFLWKWCNPFPRARARLKHAHSFDRCGGHGCLQEVAAYKRFQMWRFDLQTFGILENWLLRRGSHLREVVTTGGSIVLPSYHCNWIKLQD